MKIYLFDKLEWKQIKLNINYRRKMLNVCKEIFFLNFSF